MIVVSEIETLLDERSTGNAVLAATLSPRTQGLRRGGREELDDRIHPHAAFEAVAIRNGKKRDELAQHTGKGEAA